MAAKLFRHAKLDVNALCQLASSLRHGRPCSCDPDQAPQGGSLYWVVFVVFDDAVEWVFRSPRPDGVVQADETISKLLASEAATLRYIRSHSAIPVPEVYAYSPSKNNDIGVPYILMSKAAGFLLRKKWENPGLQQTALSTEEKSKILSQLGTITWQLSQLRFEEIGSLFEDNGHIQIKSCLSRGLVESERDTLDDLPRGPFSSEMLYFDALVSGFLQHVECLQLFHHCFLAPIPTRKNYDDHEEFRKACDHWNNFVILGSKIDGSDNRVDYTIVGDFLREMVSKETLWPSRNINAKGFPLHHPDLSVNNIFINDNCDITCIIDWAFCSSVPASILFMAPGLPMSRDELDAPLVAAFEEGLNEAMQADHGEDSMQIYHHTPAMFPAKRIIWSFSRLISFDSIGDYYLFDNIWQLSDQNNVDFLTFFRLKESSDHYLQLHKEMRQYDEPPDVTKKQEIELSQRDMLGLTVSRKLSLVSEWTSRYRKDDTQGIRRNGGHFVADDKLWRWILNSLEQAGLS
ncbi:hypothetical protein LOZ12_004424 [Ophidiomyces ophidiicola]|uniref:uncharacterized protein n=1 Tax=Ophidiomyces ophidiicola TaxID=1387563 RepID=UPI0020C2E7F7|nr:uncharacterized protein LOZ57_003022 [Ophidiomyces ophidiicola]KAI1935728.1 hypothetical protein LOZ62_005887 [Ophidiomyces ophidiicola]KAI1947871.1 hypothetical protein LOZ57_003022 [Ophidiomyces ophidiicola]KAI2021894.1 hypothetical protein LOZ45_004611 [Ophidiomyces ophidiicola]KAI2033331.1 hypothetical protein LOZ47_005436 [Ophidiomyces ophidiicola]KAI2044789.1 hypothetical protein LOZ44_004952 [Ophidiomyces ophidiicola]